MTTLQRFLSLAALLSLSFPLAARAQEAAAPTPDAAGRVIAPAPLPVPGDKPRIQIALLLDTSNSMDGLIHQAKTQLWAIVNEFIAARRDGQAPELRVALYEYGNSNLTAESGYIRQVLPLTDDLDRLSQELFALRTRGGEEYCGQVIMEAVELLEWSTNPNDYKAIFIAGNEPFTQGSVSYRDACRAAIAKGIIVNTIHCGDEAAGLQGMWKDGAQLADGSFINIDQNRVVLAINAPQDAEIARLNEALNQTYVPFGGGGRAGAETQAAQDRNSASAGAAVLAQRAMSKSSGYYNNAGWCLVDATRSGKVKLEEIKDEDLPEAMRNMTPEEQLAHIESQAARRAEIQARMAELGKARAEYVAAEAEKRGSDGPTLEKAVTESVREQAAAKAFQF